MSSVSAVTLRWIWPRISSSGICANSPKAAEAGVVDENVDGDALALQLVEQKLWRRRCGEIEGDGLDRDAVSLQFVGDLRELVGAAGDEHQVVVVAGEKLGEFVSDAAGGAGDESGGHEGILAGFYVAPDAFVRGWFWSRNQIWKSKSPP